MKKYLFACSLFFISRISFSQILINEVATTNPSLFADEDGDYPDWIELYNAGVMPVSLFHFGISDNSQWDKWLLPESTIASGGHLIIFASGKNSPVAGEVGVDHWETAMFDTSVWKYFVGLSDPPPDWNSLTFDDGVWNSGSGGFGYGDTDDNTVVPNGTITVYYRKEFFIADTSKLVRAILSMDYDDGFVAYLNGTEIARNNITGIPTHTTISDAEHEALLYAGYDPEEFDLDYNLLHSLITEGTNALSIEIHNTNSGSTDLTGRTFFHFGISDSSSFYFPNPAWFAVSNSQFHTNFKIEAGETITLSDDAGNLLDSVNTSGIKLGTVHARIPDGSSWCVTDSITPAASNTINCFTGYASVPVFSLDAGFYSSTKSTAISGNDIHFTVTGEEPTALSPGYTDSVFISSTQIIRARCFEPGKLPSEVVSNSYFISEPTSLNVLSIIATPGDLFNDGSGGPAVYDNMFGKAKCTLEYFDAGKTKRFEENASLTDVGNYSIYFPQKSMQFIFDEDYGAKGDITYNLFASDKPGIESYHGFRVRNMDDDWCCSRMKDLVANRIALPTHAAAAGVNNVAVFINGEYWGHFCTREVLDESYCNENFGADPDKVDMIKTAYYEISDYIAEEGSDSLFFPMSDYIINTDMSDSANYAAALEMIDYENWVDYFATEMYIGNIDWFSSVWFNNTRLFMATDPDIKWKFILWDLNDSQFGYTDNILYEALGNPVYPNRYTDMFNSLLNNSGFRNYFINRFADLMNYYWTPEIILPMIDSNAAEIASEIPAQSARWGSANLNDFNAAVAALKNYHNNRSPNQRNQINSYFSLNGKKNITISVNPAGAGQIKISTIIPETLPWTGSYFAGNPVTLTAVPSPGFTFSNWDANIFITDVNSIWFTADVTSTTTFVANFTGSSQPLDLVVSEVNYNSDSSINSGDWFELHNNASYDLDISNYQISDQQFYHSFTVPIGTTIPAGEYLVIDENQNAFSVQHPSVTNVIGEMPFELSNDEDRIIVKNNFLDTIINFKYHDHTPWPLAADGFGRTMESVSPSADPNMAESWFDGCVGGSPGSAYSACNENPIVSEINYHSTNVLDAGDWFELYNQGASALDMSNWSMRDQNDDHIFHFPSSTIIPANEYLVVLSDDSAFTNFFPAVTNKVSAFEFGLGNSGDAIRLYDAQGILQLSICYGDSTPWAVEADGDGYTLENADYDGNMNSAANWFAGCYGGSPGKVYNPCGVLVTNPNSFFISVYPNPASGVFNVEVYSGIDALTFGLFDVEGRKVLSSQLENGGTNPIDIAQLPPGIYWYEIQSGNGEMQRGKLIVQ